MYLILRHLIIVWFLSMSLLYPFPLWAVWEHAPFSEVTRLPQGRSATWEFAMIYGDATLYPTDFYCPGNAKVILHVLNASPESVVVRRANPRFEIRLSPGMYRKINFGTLNLGDHLFFLDTTISTDSTAVTEERSNTLGRLKCMIHATRWPGAEYTYQVGWILKDGHFLPKEIFLPSGRKTELFLGSTLTQLPSQQQIGDYTFIIKPGEVSLTEFPNPKGETLLVPLPQTDTGTVTIR